MQPLFQAPVRGASIATTTDHDDRRRGPALRRAGLTRDFGTFRAFGPVDLELAPEERIALRGPNGSGKTTLLRCLTGTLTPSAGEALGSPYPAGTLPARRRSARRCRSSARSTSASRAGRTCAVLRAAATGPERAARGQAEALVAELELEDIVRRRLDSCSTGMLQQLAFARALLGEPELLLLDEPTRSLDVDAVDRLWAALAHRPAVAVLVATHRREDLDRCGRILDFG